MISTSLHGLLLNYLEECHKGNTSTSKIKRQLEILGKNEDDIHWIITEFEDEWDKQLLQMNRLKNSKTQIFVGLVVALLFATLSIFMALKIINIGVVILFYGFVAAGILVALKGFQARRMEKLRIERREIKWRWMEKER